MVGLGVDIGGAPALEPWIEAAGCTFRHAVDAESMSSRVLGFNFVPSVFLVNEAGKLVARQILFWIDRAEHTELLSRFTAGETRFRDIVAYDDTVPSLPATPSYLDEAHRQQFDAAVSEGVRLAKSGQIEHAAASWRIALQLDPTNYILRSQIWMLLYPEKFHPTVDYAWQDQQMRKELSEIEGLVCGPDGCWIAPGA